MAARFVWHELLTPDPPRAKVFYSELFGWHTEDIEVGGGRAYTLLTRDGRDVGGIVRLEPGPLPAHWMPYVAVPRVDDTVARARDLGARVPVSPMMVPRIGRFGVVVDPQGASFAAIQLDRVPPEEPEPPPPFVFCWHGLETHDPERAEMFYASLLGWSPSAVERGDERVRLLCAEGASLATVAEQPLATATPQWTSYVCVEDLALTHERAVRLGARAILPPTDSPLGRHAVVSDPTGAVIALQER